MSDSATPWAPARQATLSITSSWSLLKLMSIAWVMPSNHLISVIPFSSRLQSFPGSGSFPMSRFFVSGGQSISFSSEYSGLISFRMDWFDLLAVQGTLEGFLRHHSSKAWIPRCSRFFMIYILMNRTWQKSWHVVSDIRLLKGCGSHLGCSLCLSNYFPHGEASCHVMRQPYWSPSQVKPRQEEDWPQAGQLQLVSCWHFKMGYQWEDWVLNWRHSCGFPSLTHAQKRPSV